MLPCDSTDLGESLGKDFNNLAKEIATYLLKNPKANMTIVIGGGYTESKDGAKDWNDPIVPGSFQGQTYSDRFNNEFKVLVNTVIELTKGKVDASRFTPEKGKIEDSLLDTKSTTQ